MRLLVRWFGAAAVAALAACAGSGAPAGGPGLPLAGTSARGETPQAVRVTIKIPKRHRAPRYLSPATQSVAITILRGTKTVVNETADLTPTSSGCTSSIAGTLCTLEILIGAGHYTASLTTYDGLNGSGNALSTAQGIAFTVKLGKANTIGLTLDGIPAKILVIGAGADSVYALAQDADGDFIVGAGAPAFTAADTAGPAVASIVQPAASKPNLITIAQASPGVSGIETIGITASYPSGTNACAETGAVCTAPSAITATYGTQLLVGNYGGGDVLGFSIPLASPTQSPDVNVGVPYVYPIVVDPHGNLFAAAYGATGSLWELSPPYASATQLNTQDVYDAYGIALDANGSVYVADTTGNYVSIFAPPYTGTPVKVTDGTSNSYAVAVDSTGTLYSANVGSDTVTAYAPPSFSGTPVSVSTASTPYSLLVEPGTLFVGESSKIELFALPLSNGESPSLTLSSGIDDAYSLAIDGSGNLYVANSTGGSSGGGSIEEFANPLANGASPAATVNYSNSGTSAYDPFSVAVGPGGYLYVVDDSGGALGGGLDEYALPLASSSKPQVAISTPAFDAPYYQAFGSPIYSVTP